MEKTEKATPYKLDKARQQGQVAKSVEWNAAMTLLTCLVVITALWKPHLSQIKSEMRLLLTASANLQFTLSNISRMFTRILMQMLTLMLPFGLALMVTVCLTNMMQTGPVWSAKALKPDMKRLHFMQSLKRFFSVKLLFDGGKNSLKFLGFSGVLTVIFHARLPAFVHLMHQHPASYPAGLMRLFLQMGVQIFLMLTSFALLDILFTRWKYARDQRMSKQDVKDEYKQREGDPKIKNKIKQLQRELRERSASVNAVKDADVVITNPTHLAVALQYRRGRMPAPRVVCKASGELVTLVRKKARQHGVDIVENKPFARALFHSVALNQYIDERFFPVAAAIFNQVFAQRKTEGV